MRFLSLINRCSQDYCCTLEPKFYIWMVFFSFLNWFSTFLKVILSWTTKILKPKFHISIAWFFHELMYARRKGKCFWLYSRKVHIWMVWIHSILDTKNCVNMYNQILFDRKASLSRANRDAVIGIPSVTKKSFFTSMKTQYKP